MSESIPKPSPDLFPRSSPIDIPPFPSPVDAEESSSDAGVDVSINEIEVADNPKLGDQKVDQFGNIEEWKATAYTLRTYFSHHTDDFGPGPGWDYRFSLDDDEYAMKRYGRTFSHDEIFDPAENMPDDPVFGWVYVGQADEKEPNGN